MSRLVLGMVVIVGSIVACSPAHAQAPAEAQAPAQIPAPAQVQAPAQALAPVQTQAGTAAPRTLYTMDDLLALEKRKSWSEMVDHLEDIAPAKRDATWDRLTEVASTGFVAAETDVFAAAAKADALFARFPGLASSKAFEDRRTDAVVAAARRCFAASSSGARCTMDLQASAKASPNNTRLAMEAGRLTILNQFAYVANRFFAIAVSGKKGRPAECKDPELQRAAKAAVEANLPADDPNMIDARTVKSVCGL